MNGTGEYLLPELGADAATEDGVIVSLMAATKTSSSELGVELGIKRRNMLRYGYVYTCLVHVRRVVTIGFAPTLTWFGVGMDGELRCGSCFVFDTAMFWTMHGEMRCRGFSSSLLGLSTTRQTLRPHTLQSSCFESKGGDVDLLPDASTC